MLFDSHCHINAKEFEEDFEQVLENARTNGVTKMMVVGYDVESCDRLPSILNREELYGAVGIFPESIDEISMEELEEKMAIWVQNKKIRAIGEIGLDYYWEKDLVKRELQKKYFRFQIQLANRYHLPIIIHSRDAIEDTYEILKEERPIQGFVMHCYSGTKEMMEKFLSLGGMISLAGPVTFKNARVPKEVAVACPLDRLLVETDCPYLTPTPYRGTRNEPAKVIYIAKEIASLRGISQEEIEEKTYQNTCRFFGVEQ